MRSAVLLLALSGYLTQAAPLPRLRISENGRFFVKEGRRVAELPGAR